MVYWALRSESQCYIARISNGLEAKLSGAKIEIQLLQILFPLSGYYPC